MLVETYYGDIAIDNDTQHSVFLWIPKKDSLSGKWMWLRPAIRCSHISLTIIDPDTLQMYKQHYHFSKKNYLLMLLKQK